MEIQFRFVPNFQLTQSFSAFDPSKDSSRLKRTMLSIVWKKKKSKLVEIIRWIYKPGSFSSPLYGIT
ncbi:hypothetical protein BPAE_0330g00010 [Botrytis paeoniae]|uniref:Uncharacterized protein n=1 Tax=Botrytis paeoniae TaxID=278948 RepID=A0A4Z1FEB5_9HELO|nr:hypothetical protein BPAE_0330g00010 [Botrytis paeoniae]